MRCFVSRSCADHFPSASLTSMNELGPSGSASVPNRAAWAASAWGVKDGGRDHDSMRSCKAARVAGSIEGGADDEEGVESCCWGPDA